MSIESDLRVLYKILRANQKSITKARTEVFKALWHQPPLSMRELEKRVGAKIDRASIYRAIELFEQLHIIKKVYQGWKYRIELSEEFNPHHHHIRCMQCGETYDFDEPKSLDLIITEISQKYRFKIHSHQFEIDGVCKKCQA